jgi:serine/threonine protein kinase
MPDSDKFEHFKVLRRPDGTLWELGRGAMGVTYKAFDTNLHCDVALKVISPEYLNSDAVRQRFLREAQAAAQLRHPNVATVFHLGRSANGFFYAMEYVDGETLECRVQRRGPLPTELALHVARQVARALMAADKQKLVHRDIKPSNIMLVPDAEDHLLVKVIDFGLAKRLSSGADQSATVAFGGFVGTPQFASPEQLEERDIDIRSDIYSLGATLWFMLTGAPPYQGSVASVIHQHLAAPLPDAALATLDPSMVRILRQCLAKNPNDRFQTPLDLKQALDETLVALKPRHRPLDSNAAATQFPTNAPVTRFPTEVPASVTGVPAEPQPSPDEELVEEQPRTSPLLLRVVTAIAGAMVLLALVAVLLVSFFFRKSEPEKVSVHEGYVSLTTKPDGCTIRLKGGRELGKTPLVKYQLPLGKQVLEIESPGYQTRSVDVDVTNDSINNLGQIVLVREVGEFVVKTNPPGVPFRLIDSENKVTSGVTPFTVQNMPTGKYQVKFQRPGWPDVVEDADLKADGSVTIQHTFQGVNVSIKSDPSGATIYSGDRVIGKTPLTCSLPVAPVELSSKIGSLAPVTKRMTPDQNGTSVVEFKHAYGLLSISADRTDAEVFIGGIDLGHAPIEGILPPGKHQVVVKVNGFSDQARTADVLLNHRQVMKFVFGDGVPDPNRASPVDKNNAATQKTPAQPGASPTPVKGAKPTNSIFHGNSSPTNAVTPNPSPASSRPRQSATPVFRTREEWEQAKKEAFRKFDSDWDARKDALKEQKKSIEYQIDHSSGPARDQWKSKKELVEDRMDQLDEQRDHAKDDLKRKWND